jgi:hypothetical protein
MFLRLACFGLVWVLVACSQQAPSWGSLISAKISEQYPTYTVLESQDGQLRVLRPGQPDSVIEVGPVAQFCQRGPADCNYALDQLLIGLRGAQ